MDSKMRNMCTKTKKHKNKNDNNQSFSAGVVSGNWLLVSAATSGEVADLWSDSVYIIE